MDAYSTLLFVAMIAAGVPAAVALLPRRGRSVALVRAAYATGGLCLGLLVVAAFAHAIRDHGPDSGASMLFAEFIANHPALLVIAIVDDAALLWLWRRQRG